VLGCTVSVEQPVQSVMFKVEPLKTVMSFIGATRTARHCWHLALVVVLELSRPPPARPHPTQDRCRPTGRAPGRILATACQGGPVRSFTTPSSLLS
jgi:hypothetical protein